MLLASLLSGLVVHGTEVHVTVIDRSSGQRCREEAVVSAVPEDGAAERVESAQAEGRAVLDLGEGVWRVRGQAKDCWSTTALWASGTGADIAVELFPAATLHGTFSAAGQKPPAALAASAFRIAPGGGARSRLSEAEPLDCSVDLSEWSCRVPAGLPVDVRLEPPGFAPVHLWQLVLQPEERRDAGAHRLAAGASIAGWVENPEGEPLAGAVISMAPLQPEHPDGGRAVAAEYRAKSDASGFFQISQIVPGAYRLVSRAEKLAPAVVPAITIRPLAALTWPRALRHSPAVTFHLTIEPAKTAGGVAWNAMLHEADRWKWQRNLEMAKHEREARTARESGAQ